MSSAQRSVGAGALPSSPGDKKSGRGGVGSDVELGFKMRS